MGVARPPHGAKGVVKQQPPIYFDYIRSIFSIGEVLLCGFRLSCGPSGGAKQFILGVPIKFFRGYQVVTCLNMGEEIFFFFSLGVLCELK
jgi:hypothetical protein